MDSTTTEDPAPPRKKRLDDDHRRTNEGKTVILFGLLLTDFVFNSTLEYDEWDSYPRCSAFKCSSRSVPSRWSS